MKPRTISIAIPTYNRYEMLFESFDAVKDNDNVGEIVIVDDCSDIEIYNKVEKKAKENPKIKLHRNEKNIDCYFNKKRAIELCENDFVILLDSDNKIGFDYLYSLFQILDWKEDTIYTPEFARPHFNFTQFSGLLITKGNVSYWLDEDMFQTMLNAANYFVNKDFYLKVWDGTIDPVTSDSIYMAYRWLEAGGKIQVVSGLQYDHKVHEGSHYKNNVHRTPQNFHEQIVDKLKKMFI